MWWEWNKTIFKSIKQRNCKKFLRIVKSWDDYRVGESYHRNVKATAYLHHDILFCDAWILTYDHWTFQPLLEIRRLQVIGCINMTFTQGSAPRNLRYYDIYLLYSKLGRIVCFTTKYYSKLFNSIRFYWFVAIRDLF